MKAVLISIGILIFSAFSIAQTPTPSPTPAGVVPEDDEQVVKITTSLIRLDVTVVNSKGEIIRDLRPEEIEVYENGKKQDVSGFSFVSKIKESAAEGSKPVGEIANNIPSQPLRPEQVRDTMAFVVDDLRMSYESIYYTRRALKKYIEEQMGDGDMVAIIRTSSGVGALQQFTANKKQLLAAVEKIRWNSLGGRISTFDPIEAKPTVLAPDGSQIDFAGMDEVAAEQEDFRRSMFSTGTLGATGYVIRGMMELPGRKSVLLVSEGFRMFSPRAGGSFDMDRTREAMRRLVDQANRASVVINTIDPRGLQYAGLTAADNTAGRTASEISETTLGRQEEMSDTQDSLRYLAAQTGGTSIVNNNDIAGGIRRVLDDQSYYLVSYEPDQGTFDPASRKFNELSVKVLRPGAKARYRSGFYGVSTENIKPEKSQTVGQRMMRALVSPFGSNEISLRLNGIFNSNERTGSYIRSLLFIPGDALTFKKNAAGELSAVFDVIAANFGDTGAVTEEISKTYTISINEKQGEAMIKSGFVYDLTFPVKKPGAYQLRIALHDHGSDKIGSVNQFVEVPNLKKKKLTPSGIVMQNYPYDVWAKLAEGKAAGTENYDPLAATALRQFKTGTVLTYGLSIFNVQQNSGVPPDVVYILRLYKDNKKIFEGKEQAFRQMPETPGGDVYIGASLNLGSSMATGDYILEITVTDRRAKGKFNKAVQYAQFEIIE